MGTNAVRAYSKLQYGNLTLEYGDAGAFRSRMQIAPECRMRH